MDIQLPQILFQIINFSVVLGALTLLLYKPILKILADRAKRIEEGQKAANEAMTKKEELEALEAVTKKKLEAESAKIMEKASQEALAEQQQILAQAKTKAQAEMDGLRDKWQIEKAQLMREMQSELVATIVATSAKVIEKELKPKDHEALITSQLATIIKQI